MKALLSILFVFLILIAGAFIVPSFIDWSQYKGQIKTQVEKATGYQLEINGELRAAFLPTPHVVINKVAIDSAGAKGPVAFKAQVEKASVSLAFMPLLSRNIAVSDVTLINPVVDAREQQVATEAQKQLEQLTSDSATEPKASPNVQLDNVYLENAKLSYKPLSGEVMSVELPKMTLNADSLTGPFAFDGRILYQTFDLELDGKIGEFDKTKPLTTSLNINGGAYALSYSGLVDLTKDEPEVQGELSVNANSIQSLAAQFGAKDIKIKDQSMALTGLIAGSPKAIRLDNGQLKLGGAKAMPVKFNFMTDAKKGSVKIQGLPGGGMVDLDIAMGDATTLSGQIDIQNIKMIAVDTLGVVEAKTFNNPQVPNKITGDIKASLGDVMALTSQSLMVGTYKLAGTNIQYQTGEPAKINLAIQNFEGANIKANGTLNMAQGVNVSVSHPNAAQFIKVFQKDFQSSDNLSKPFALAGLVKTQGDMIDVSNMTAKIGTIDAKGSLSMNNGGAIPSIKADLQFGNLDTRELMTGKTSTANKSSGGASASSSKSTSAPWTRDAIDTSALRAMNIDLTAKADQLVHGTWLISNPTIDIDLNNGVLDINTIKGGLFDGSVDLSGRLSAKAEGQPLSITSKIATSNIDLSKLVKAALSQNKERVVGTASFNIDLSTTGLSSSALIYALNGDGKITTSDMIIKGIDLGKVTEAISDESLTDLAAVVQGAFKTGQTPFVALDHPIVIREGAMPLNALTLVSPTANIISDGTVNFASWTMNVKNTVDFTNPDDLPSVEMTLKGPLNAPQQSVANDILVSFIKNKYGAKIQNKVNELIGDKLGTDSPAAGIINNLLGLPQQPQKQVQPTPAPAANDNIEAEPQAVAPSEPQTQPKLEEQLIKGLFDQLAK